MSLPRAAALESRIAGLTLAVFGNIRLLNGAAQFSAILDRNIATVGEYDLTGERRDRITLKRAAAAGFSGGQAIAVDPAQYTTAELDAMGKIAWKLDRIESDDGTLITWWLK